MHILGLEPLILFHRANDVSPNFDVSNLFLPVLSRQLFALHKSIHRLPFSLSLIHIKPLVEINQVPVHYSDRFKVVQSFLPLHFRLIRQSTVVILCYRFVIFLSLGDQVELSVQAYAVSLHILINFLLNIPVDHCRFANTGLLFNC